MAKYSKDNLRSASLDRQGEYGTLENLQSIDAAVNSQEKIRMLVAQSN